MTKAQREAILERIQKEGAEAVAKDANVAELTLLRAITGSKGVHPGSVALVEQFAARRAK
jgi:hypothetical protein